MAWGVPKIGAVAEVASGALTLAEPAGVAVVDLMVACIAARDAPAFSVPAGWDGVVATQQSSGDTDATNGIASGVMIWGVRGASAPTLVFPRTAGNVGRGCIIAYTPTAGFVPSYDTGSANTLAALNTILSAPAIITAQAGELIVAMVALGDTLAISNFFATDPSTASGAIDTTNAPTNGVWRERVDSSTATGADLGFGIADAVRATAGNTGGFSATASGTGRHVMIVGAFKETAAAPPAHKPTPPPQYAMLLAQ
jgi:hypothetical protein